MFPDGLKWNLVTLGAVPGKKGMQSPVAGIGFCKTKFHLPG